MDINEPRERPMPKVPRTAMRTWMLRQLKDQGGLCPVCRKDIDITQKGEGVIDHSHATGEIRGVLHRSCNAALGKVDNAAGRWGAKSMEYSAIIPWLKNMIEYYEGKGTGWIYSLHRTPDERKDAARAKAKEARAALKARRLIAQQRRQEGST